jgi:cytochrome c oxidase subunit 1
MLIFSNAMHVVGLLGAPRRTPLGQAPYIPEEWTGHLLRVSIGGAILFVSGFMYIFTMIKTARGVKAEEGEQVEVPVAESIHDPQETPAWLDRWLPWIIATIALLIVAYGPSLIEQISNIQLNSPGGRVW